MFHKIWTVIWVAQTWRGFGLPAGGELVCISIVCQLMCLKWAIQHGWLVQGVILPGFLGILGKSINQLVFLECLNSHACSDRLRSNWKEVGDVNNTDVWRPMERCQRCYYGSTEVDVVSGLEMFAKEYGSWTSHPSHFAKDLTTSHNWKV
jgi:hypothetical protein